MLKSIGSFSASAYPIISAIGFKLYYFTAYSEANKIAQLPSLILLALAPVIVPYLFLSGNTGLNFDILSFINL